MVRDFNSFALILDFVIKVFQIKSFLTTLNVDPEPSCQMLHEGEHIHVMAVQ